MARRGLSARGERSLYRVRTAPDGSYAIVGSPWMPVPAVGRPEILAAARAVIAAELDVPADGFDVAME